MPTIDVYVALGLDADDDMMGAKKKMLGSLGLAMAHELDGLAENGSRLSQFLDTLRICLLTAREIYTLPIVRTPPIESSVGSLLPSPISPRNERLAIEQARSILSPPMTSAADKTLTMLASALTTVANASITPPPDPTPPHPFLAVAAAQSISCLAHLHDDLPTGRGLIAQSPIPPDTSILTVPASLILSSQAATTSPTLSPVLTALRASPDDDFEDALHPDTLLLLLLLHERSKGAASKWSWWFDSLPHPFHNTLSMDEEELVMLTGTPLVDDTRLSIMDLHYYYERLFPLLTDEYPDAFRADLCTWEDWVWARSVCDTRCVTMQWGDEEEKRTCLVPVMDMLNHHPQGQISHPRYNQSTDSVELPAFARVEAGAEVFLNYGPLQNRQLLMYYGFLMENNPYESLELDLQPSDDDPAMIKKTIILHHLDLPCTHHILDDGALPPRLLAAIRICLADKAELAAAGRAFDSPLSNRNESLACENLTRILQGLLEALTAQGEDGQESGGERAGAAPGVIAQGDEVASYRRGMMRQYKAQHARVVRAAMRSVERLMQELPAAAEEEA